MKIFVTGGAGRVGEAAVRRLVGQGHEVTVIGRSQQANVGSATYVRCSINDYDRLLETMRHHEAVVHLAATPTPDGVAGRDMVHANVQGTFNVYEAAVEVGISRVVAASSINATGFFYGDRSFPLEYLPVDENHPTLATDAYSFTKRMGEEVGKYFFDRERVTGVALRLPGVLSHELFVQRQQDWGANPGPVAEHLLGLSDDERLPELERLQTAYDTFRRANRLDQLERGASWRERRKHRDLLTREEHIHMSGLVNFFAYLHEEDSAVAIERSVTLPYDGFHVLFVNAAKNSMGLPLSDIAKLFYPPVPAAAVDPQRSDTCVPAIGRAREVIGFDPEWELRS
ncbi:MAG: NAD-dependent epimerase/dehydratase family protein [Spirochaetales bacterium]